MRGIQYALAIVLILGAGRLLAQQQGGDPNAQQQARAAGQGAGGRGVTASPMATAEQALQQTEHDIQAGQAGRGGGAANQGVGGGPSPDDDKDVDQYVNTTDFFSVSVPCKFTAKDITWATEYDSKVPGRVYSCHNAASNTDYEMSVINYKDIISIRRAQEHTQAAGGDAYARIDLAASIDYACTKIRNEAAKVTYDAWHYINLIPGHELQTTLADGRRVYAAVYLHEYRLYIMKATSQPKGIPPLLYTQSFAIVRADGSAVRYPTIYRHPW
jgi:hypothetical protein